MKITYRDAGILSYVSGTVSRVWDGKTFELRAFGSSRRRKLEGDREDQPPLRFPTARFELHKIVRVSGHRFHSFQVKLLLFLFPSNSACVLAVGVENISQQTLSEQLFPGQGGLSYLGRLFHYSAVSNLTRPKPLRL